MSLNGLKNAEAFLALSNYVDIKKCVEFVLISRISVEATVG